MLKPRGQTGLKAKNLFFAPSFWPRPYGFGLGIESEFNIFYFLACSDLANCRRSLQVIARLSYDNV